MRCKAVVCEELGPPEMLKFRDVEVGKPHRGQVLLEVKAIGLNFPDSLIITGKYQFKPSLPFSPGGECSGIVREVGEGVKDFKVGQRVTAMLGWGAMSEFVVVDAFKLIPVPDEVAFEVAAAFNMTYGTTIHAFRQRAKLQPGETVLVLGASGGVGLAAVDLAKAMGAKVIAAASSDEKLEVCRQFGADHCINYSNENLRDKIKEITQNNGVDVVYDPVGDKFAEPAIRSLAWNGRYLVIGFAGGEIPRIPLNLYLLKSGAAVGVFWGAFTSREPEKHLENTQMLLKMLAEKKINPLVTQTYSLQDSGKAIRDMMERRVKGKAVIIPRLSSSNSNL